MFFPTLLPSLLFLTTIPHTTNAKLGINCRGSSLCDLASWDNEAPESIVQILHDAVWASSKPNTTSYASGAHIICVSDFQPVTLSLGFKGGAGDDVDVSGNFSLSGSLHEGGICVFPNDLRSNATLSLEQIRPLTSSVLEHGCNTCGSAPVHYVDQHSNDPSDGYLTFDYVAAPYCDGDCISDNGIATSTISTSTRRERRAMRFGTREEAW